MFFCLRDHNLCPPADVEPYQRDIAACPCQSGLKLAFAYVMLVNRAQAVTAAELAAHFNDDDTIIGYAEIFMVHSERAIGQNALAQQTDVPAGIDLQQIFSQGIAQGIQPYRMYDEAIDGPNEEAVDGFPITLAPEQLFDFEVCTQESATCEL